MEVVLMGKGLEKSEHCLNRAKNYLCDSQTRKTPKHMFNLKSANITLEGRTRLKVNRRLRTLPSWDRRILVFSLK